MAFAIVVVAYNRPRETRRLLESISRAEYDSDQVDLIISIDKGERQDEIVEIAEDFNWSIGKRIVRSHDHRLGLKRHVFTCGSYSKDYDGIIVLEDDLVVSPSFYLFSKEACQYYGDDPRVAQISLYSYAVNEFEARPFYPCKIDSDVYAMQVVQSWGECWTNAMWQRFERSPYCTLEELPLNRSLHHRINDWGSKSWKRHFANYIVDNDLYVVYPYTSLTSNYSEAGEHSKRSVPDYHVVMLEDIKHDFKFRALDNCVKYDGFFERLVNSNEYADYCFDLYGSKKAYSDCRYVISTNALPYRIMNEFGLLMKPQESNVFENVPGNTIRVYDTLQPCKPPHVNHDGILRYDYSYLSWKSSLYQGIGGLLDSISRHLSRFLNR